MMNRKRVIFALCALLALGGVVSAAQADEPPNHANRLEATFTETNVSVTNRVADLGVFQLINTGTGTVEGLGSATLMLSATQDRSVHPCGTEARRTRPSGESCSPTACSSCGSWCTSARPIPAPAARAHGRWTAPRAPGSSPAPAGVATSRSSFQRARQRSPAGSTSPADDQDGSLAPDDSLLRPG